MSQSLLVANIVCGSLEAMFYGINCMLFGYCVRVLTSTETSSRRVFTAAVVQFSLSTAHVITTLITLVQAFALGGDPVAYYEGIPSNAYIIGFYFYVINTYVQELLLIWRLYGLWGQELRICIIPLLFWTAHVVIGTITVSSLIPDTALATPQYLVLLGLIGWGLETATNLTANFGIAYRLWKAQRRTAPLGTQRRFDYYGTMLLILECGALITTCTVIMFCLFISGHHVALAGNGIATQIATVSPLFIVMRVGLSQTRSRPNALTMSSRPLEMNVLHMQDTYSEYTSQGTEKPRDDFLEDEARGKV